MALLESYIPVAIFAVVGVVFPLGAFIISSFVRPTVSYPAKYTTYECGEIPVSEAWHQFNIQYYMYAILLVIFDVEVLFFYPWAVVYVDMGIEVFAAGLLFLLIVFLGLLYEWKKGVLEWAQ